MSQSDGQYYHDNNYVIVIPMTIYGENGTPNANYANIFIYI